MNERQWGKKVEQLAISIATAARTYRRWEAIELDIVLKNFGEDSVPVVVRSPWIDYHYALALEGREIPKTDYAVEMIESAAEGRRMMRQLKPGETLSDRFPLSRAFDLSLAGVYKVIASRETFKGDDSGEFVTVVSNVWTFTVVE